MPHAKEDPGFLEPHNMRWSYEYPDQCVDDSTFGIIFAKSYNGDERAKHGTVRAGTRPELWYANGGIIPNSQRYYDSARKPISREQEDPAIFEFKVKPYKEGTRIMDPSAAIIKVEGEIGIEALRGTAHSFDDYDRVCVCYWAFDRVMHSVWRLSNKID